MNTQEILKPIAGDFELWYMSTNNFVHTPPFAFYDLTPDFQLGVLLRYFRERWGIDIYIDYQRYELQWQYTITIMDINKVGTGMYAGDLTDDYYEAFFEALTKAVELVKGEVK